MTSSGAFLMPGKDEKMLLDISVKESAYVINDVCMVGRKPPVAHPKNCRNECPYGHNRSYCFPCYKKIMEERRAAKAQMTAEG